MLGLAFFAVARKQIPFQLKVINARIVAQAGILTGAAGFALASALEGGAERKGPKTAATSWQLRDYSLPSPPPPLHGDGGGSSGAEDVAAAGSLTVTGTAAQLK